MPDQDDGSDLAASTAAALARARGPSVSKALTGSFKSFVKGAQIVGRAAVGLAKAPGEDNEYARRYNTD